MRAQDTAGAGALQRGNHCEFRGAAVSARRAEQRIRPCRGLARLSVYKQGADAGYRRRPTTHVTRRVGA
jgi:hypothetical protein